MGGPIRRLPLPRYVELGCWAAGVLLVALQVASGLATQIEYEAALRSFEQARNAPETVSPGTAADGLTYSEPDQSLWSPERVRRYRDARLAIAGRPEAVLRIPRLRVEVPVFAGATDDHMTRGAGRIAGSPGFGEPGNVGISSHRDGHFRSLKDVRVGDEILVDTPRHRYRYVVAEIRITDPDDTMVLWPGSVPEVTLITCYPFYYFGNAPRRFVVRAELHEESP